MSHFARNATLAAAAFAMVGSTLFGGAALAGGWDKKDVKKENTKLVFAGGDGGVAGDAATDCTASAGVTTLTTVAAPITDPVVGSNFCPALGGDANGAPAIEGENG
jgi:hypothetical protein